MSAKASVLVALLLARPREIQRKFGPVRLLLSLLVPGLLVGCTADLTTTYGAWQFGRSGGYTVRQFAPNRWRIRGVSTAFADRGFGYRMAFYRAAILAKAAGFQYMQIVDYDGELMVFGGTYTRPYMTDLNTPLSGSRGNEDVTISVVGVANPDGPIACEADEQFRQACQTIAVDAVLDEFARPLAQSAAQTQAELEAARQTTPQQ